MYTIRSDSQAKIMIAGATCLIVYTLADDCLSEAIRLAKCLEVGTEITVYGMEDDYHDGWSLIAGAPVLVDEEYERGVPGRACVECNTAWPASEPDDAPWHHQRGCSQDRDITPG